MTWKKCDPSLVGKVIYPFNQKVPHGLALSLGETVIIKSQNEDWYHGYSLVKSTVTSTLGIFPCSYVKIIGRDDQTNSNEDRDSDSSTETLKIKMLHIIVTETSQWVSDMITLYQENAPDRFAEAESTINRIMELFYEIANWSVNREKLLKLQSQLWNLINKINSLLNCDTIIRSKNLSIISVPNLPLMHLEQLHMDKFVSANEHRLTFDGGNFSSGTSAIKSDSTSSNNLQVVVENIEFFGCLDEIVLQWMICDIMNEWQYEPFWQPIREVKKGRPQWMGEKFIFKDVSGEIRKDGNFLTVYVFRIGQLLTDPNKQLTGKFRRPMAFGSCCLKEIPSDAEKTTINLYNLNDADFLRPTKEILRMRFPAQAQSRSVQVSLSIFDQIQSGQEALTENHILESVYLRNDAFYESDRHCLYFKIESAEFDRANKTSARNVESQISIQTSSGEKKPCISLNPDNRNNLDYISSVTYHCNSPRWKDIIKINLASINMSESHILIDFYHCTTKDKKGEERKYFASSFIRLQDFLDCGNSSKTFSLIVHKISTSARQEPKKYLGLQSVSSIDQEKNSLKEYCKITLVLCSTCLSNNKSVNEFLFKNSESNISISQLRQYLKLVQIISNEDFLKPQLRKNITEMIKDYILFVKEETIQIELFITWQILSDKYIKFGLKEELLFYMRARFQFIDNLLKGINYVLRDAMVSKFPFDILEKVTGSMGSIFMILPTYTDVEYHFQISERIKDILRQNIVFFKGYEVADTNKDIRKLIFDYTLENLKYLQQLISIDVLIDYFNNLFASSDFLNAKILAKEKLEFINKLLKSRIHEDCTDVLLVWFIPTVHLCTKLMDSSSPHILQATEILLDFFSEMKKLLQEEQIDMFSQKEMKSFFLQTFSVFTAKQFRDTQKNKYLLRQETVDSSQKVELTVSLECQKMYTLLFSYLEEWYEISNVDITVTEFYTVLLNIKILLEASIYPKSWLSMYLKISKICYNIFRKATGFLQTKTEEAFNKLIPVFFEACYAFIIQSCLQLQNFLLPKKQKILDEYGDMRIDVMDYFLFVWKIKPAKLDSFDKNFTVQTTMKVLNISLLAVSGIRCKTIPLLVHTIANWLDKCDDPGEVLRDLISETELLLRDGHGDEAYYEILYKIIQLGKMQPDVSLVVERFTTLINLHLEYRKLSLPNSNKLHCQFLLYTFMKFYQDEVNIFTHFYHYGNKLSQILEEEEHFFEAALVIKQHYDCIYWNYADRSVDTVFYENYEGMGNEQQKEQLRNKILDLLNETKEYEYAADLCKELYTHYLEDFKYKELSPLLKQCANYYELIMTEPRLMLNYYRVTFIGGILPGYMKHHRDYIVKGSIWFKINSISTMLQEAFPDAKIQFYQSTTPVESPYEQKMIIYLAKMEPIPQDTRFTKNRKISIKIRTFFKDHSITNFFSDHPFHKGSIDKENEVKTLHICRVTVMSEMIMPNLFMWNPIVFEERKTLTPIDVATDTVTRKNQTIRDTIDEFVENPNRDLKSFTMLLTGTLDAGVNGGMKKYMEAFFSDTSEDELPIDAEHLDCFREVLIEQKNVLSEALAIHKKLAPPPIQPLHERLEECFIFLNKMVMELDISHKRSFSNIRSLDDCYAQMHDLIAKTASGCSFESPSMDRQFSFSRENSRVSENHVLNFSDERYRSGDDIPRMSVATLGRQSHSGSDKVLCRERVGSKLSRRLISSTEEETLLKLANQYYLQNNETIIPSLSSPDIGQPSNHSSLEEMKLSPIKSPPLPPSNNEPETNTYKQRSRSKWKIFTISKKSKDFQVPSQMNSTAAHTNIRQKVKMAAMDIFPQVSKQ